MIDPLSVAVKIAFERSNGITLFERTLETAAFTPGNGLGWTMNGSGTKWTFLDKPYVQFVGIRARQPLRIARRRRPA
jgi:hypothetical protein